jgi:hypothetical protein
VLLYYCTTLSSTKSLKKGIGMIWTVDLLEDPLDLASLNVETRIAHASCALEDLFLSPDELWSTFSQGGRTARVALADYVARVLSRSYYQDEHHQGWSLHFEPLDRTTIHTSRSYRQVHTSHKGSSSRLFTDSGQKFTPFVFERTDIVACQPDNRLHIYLRFFATGKSIENGDKGLEKTIQHAAVSALQKLFHLRNLATRAALMQHVGIAVLQERLRAQLADHERLNAVAFVADGSILPRKSGASAAPMPSPPAVPFVAPASSPMCRTVNIEMGDFHPYITEILPGQSSNNGSSSSIVSLSGLLVPRGVSLIVGGGYHGKSTLLRCLAAGVYNKIPGDGRELCVTVDDAVTVRAEDGRYVNNCNVSAFISNLPTAALDTKHFSSGEASGSTSQAANVVEAMEMGASAFLVDEDVSAANFMARDGRMRSLVMDESITPLLYRVNGLYASHGISSIVVVGGVGDWLDVPDSVILMDKYVCKDATAKARSISKQFSHGHVQYAGRGVVHRLDWEKAGTPIPRRPAVSDGSPYDFQLASTAVSLLDGSDTISLQQVGYQQYTDTNNKEDAMSIELDDDDEEERYIDMSRCEQLMGKKPQLYGCGLCVVWLMEVARKHPELGLPDLLKKADQTLDERSLLSLISNATELIQSDSALTRMSATWNVLVESLGCAYRPRRFEIGQALTRLRGISLEEIPVEDDGSEAAAKAEAERKRQELLEIWNRRRKNPFSSEE